MEEKDFELRLTLESGYRMIVDFGGDIPPTAMDEPEPLGAGTGPNPARMLASAVGGCLGASLMFCLRRARAEVGAMQVDVRGRMVRNDRGRLRIGGLVVTLRPEMAEEDRERITRCVSLFEDYCVVSESVRRGIPIEVEVAPVPLQAIVGTA
ncbi:MAG TPA: OsmC family protein [Longimicrobiales bacterium]|nr:OsmC family protein [Longimicrobiales bacterium]